MNKLDTTRQKAKTWVFDIAAPLWSTKGVHADGMFVEEFNHDGTVIDNYRRLMVQARQIFSFCTIGSLGWGGPWKEIVAKAIIPFTQKGINKDNLFIHTFGSDGNPKDSHLDLYDQAFGLFALAYAGKYLERPELFTQALTTLKVLKDKWARPEGGFWEGEITPCPPYRQNPHMHIFEASLINYRFSGAQEWRDMADQIANLFVKKFQQNQSAVTEYFDKNWHPLEGEKGKIAEPGHCFEWSWLFETAWDDGRGIKTASELVTFARKYGICPKRHVAINEVSLDGKIIDAKARLWPQTERLKAACARYKRTKSEAEIDEIAAAWDGLEKYFATNVKGLWHDKMNPDGSFIIEPVKASSFYHITCAFGELMKL